MNKKEAEKIREELKKYQKSWATRILKDHAIENSICGCSICQLVRSYLQ